MPDVLMLVEPTQVEPAMHISLATLRIQIYKEKMRMTRTIICLWEKSERYVNYHKEKPANFLFLPLILSYFKFQTENEKLFGTGNPRNGLPSRRRGISHFFE